MKKFVVFSILILVCITAVLWQIFYPCNEAKTTIRFSSWGSQTETALLIPLIKQFESENPDIKVEFIHIPQNYFQKLHLLFASNLAPDVVFINNHYAPKYIKAGLLCDLSGYVNKNDYFDKALQGFIFEDKIYAVPRDVSNLVIYYNKDLFKQYDVPFPDKNWTMSDFLAAAKKLTRNDLKGIGYETDMIFVLPYLFSNGGAILSEDGKTLEIDKKETLEALDNFSALANVYKVAPKKSETASRTTAQMFLQKKIAMHLSGRWLVPKYRQEADFDWDIAPFPKGKNGSVVNIDASGYALSKASAHKKEAIKFIEFISSKDSLNALSKSGLIVPARKDSAYSDMFLDKAQKPLHSRVFVDVIATGKVTPVNENYQKITDYLKIALEPVYLGKRKAHEVITHKLLIDLSRYAY